MKASYIVRIWLPGMPKSISTPSTLNDSTSAWPPVILATFFPLAALYGQI